VSSLVLSLCPRSPRLDYGISSRKADHLACHLDFWCSLVRVTLPLERPTDVAPVLHLLLLSDTRRIDHTTSQAERLGFSHSDGYPFRIFLAPHLLISGGTPWRHRSHASCAQAFYPAFPNNTGSTCSPRSTLMCVLRADSPSPI
jgi:hypothetical protein